MTLIATFELILMRVLNKTMRMEEVFLVMSGNTDNAIKYILSYLSYICFLSCVVLLVHPPVTGWVVTWFLLGYTVRMFEYTVRTFRLNVGRFLYVFSSIPRKLYTIFQPTFPPIKRYQDSIFKLLTLSTYSVTNVVRTAYFQIQARSSPLKNL